MTHRAVRCAIMRGGSSKAVIFAHSDLPPDIDDRDRLILGAFGSPDPRQVDGLGGADPLTSKVAIVARPSRSGADVDYTFGQVGIASPVVNYAFSCGNTAAAVALWAVEEQWVKPVDGLTQVRIQCTNNGKRITAAVTAGAEKGARVRLEFHDPGGGDTGSLLPSGEASNQLRTASGTQVRFSLVDCGNLYAIIPAATWSLTGSETPTELDCNAHLLREIEELREAIPARLLSAGSRRVPPGNLASRLKIAIVGRPPADPNDAADIVARIINPERVHKAFAVTGAMNLAAAAAIPGSIVAELMQRRPSAGRDTVRIRHPQGVVAPDVVFDGGPSQPNLRCIGIDRTARRIMNGIVYVPARSPCA